jgi:hypothetical protein
MAIYAPDSLVVFTQALYASSPGTESAPNGPEQLHMRPTWIGAPVADREPPVDVPPEVVPPEVVPPEEGSLELLALDPHAAAKSASSSTAAKLNDFGTRLIGRLPAERSGLTLRSKGTTASTPRLPHRKSNPTSTHLCDVNGLDHHSLPSTYIRLGWGW